MLFLPARVKKQPVVCFATRPLVLPIPIYFMWTFVLLPISFFQQKIYRWTFSRMCTIEEAHLGGNLCHCQGSDEFDLSNIFTNELLSTAAGRGTASPAVERFSIRGHFHHTNLQFVQHPFHILFAMFFFRRKGCTSRQAFYYKLAKQLSQF